MTEDPEVDGTPRPVPRIEQKDWVGAFARRVSELRNGADAKLVHGLAVEAYPKFHERPPAEAAELVVEFFETKRVWLPPVSEGARMGTKAAIHELVSGKTALREVFDHLRNIGICGAVAAAGVWQVHAPTAAGFSTYAARFSAGSLFAVAAVMFVLNAWHGWLRLKDGPTPYWIYATVGTIYGSAAIVIVASIASR